MESRTEATVTTYLVHVRAFLQYLAATYPSVELGDVTKLQVRANDEEVTHRSIMAHHNGARGTGRVRPAATHAAQYLKKRSRAE
jgi:hypothetical protein